MDKKTYTAGLAALRQLRDEMKPLERELAKLERQLAPLRARRDEQIKALGDFGKAQADRLATSAGLSVIDVVALVPRLGPQRPSSKADAAPLADSPAEVVPRPQQAAQAVEEPVGAVAPVLPRLAEPPAQLESPVEESAGEVEPQDLAAEPVEAEPSLPSPAAAAPVPPAAAAERQLPSLPAGEAGDRWVTVTPGLLSTRPKHTQAIRKTAFLDAATGVLVYRDGTARVDLGQASVAEIINAVFSTLPEPVERIYITAGDPWHRNADRHPFLKDAVAEWLNGPLPEGWTVESSRGRDRLAGHFVHPRNPVGRWQRGRDQHLEICSVGQWFEVGDADPATVRDAFVLLWKALRQHWNDAVVMGTPSRTGIDLWSRTIPAKAGSRWSEGYPVMSEEIRGLLHATAGQGRTELLTPPRVPAQLKQWTELDRTFAYAKHTWESAVGEPKRITAQRFAAMPEKEQTRALYAPSHWQVRVTIPEGWEHVGLLPAPAPGERAWEYPYEPGRQFVTWAGGAEINLALRNPIAPWRIEILDGLVWERGEPLKGWATKLKESWGGLQALSVQSADERQRTAARLASRAVRSILLYGIGAFAQRPKVTNGSVALEAGQVPEGAVPDGAQITGISDTHVTWKRDAGFSRDPYAHPEWAAGVWSQARAALLSTSTGKDPATGQSTKVGALYLPAGSIVAFRTDAVYTTADVNWPYTGTPGDYLVKGRLPWPVSAPTTDEEFFSLQHLGREHLAESEEGQ